MVQEEIIVTIAFTKKYSPKYTALSLSLLEVCKKSLFVSDNLSTAIAIRPQDFRKCVRSSVFSLRVKCGCMFILWLNWKCFRDTKWLNVNMNDFREVSAKVYSQTAFRMLETEYKVHVWCKSRYIDVRRKHIILMMLLLLLLLFHFIKDFIRMIYLARARIISSLLSGNVLYTHSHVPRHVDAVNSIRKS